MKYLIITLVVAAGLALGLAASGYIYVKNGNGTV
jgi:hypothetical protein